jgi:hypothetical protein
MYIVTPENILRYTIDQALLIASHQSVCRYFFTKILNLSGYSTRKDKLFRIMINDQDKISIVACRLITPFQTPGLVEPVIDITLVNSLLDLQRNDRKWETLQVPEISTAIPEKQEQKTKKSISPLVGTGIVAAAGLAIAAIAGGIVLHGHEKHKKIQPFVPAADIDDDDLRQRIHGLSGASAQNVGLKEKTESREPESGSSSQKIESKSKLELESGVSSQPLEPAQLNVADRDYDENHSKKLANRQLEDDNTSLTLEEGAPFMHLDLTSATEQFVPESVYISPKSSIVFVTPISS